MAGNVWEWTASEWESGSKIRVFRGGAFDFEARYVRCAFRLGFDPKFRYASWGFRVCVVSQQD
jgi:formylglycine-generating enzyme required for sulfatase activity